MAIDVPPAVLKTESEKITAVAATVWEAYNALNKTMGSYLQEWVIGDDIGGALKELSRVWPAALALVRSDLEFYARAIEQGATLYVTTDGSFAASVRELSA